MPPTLSRCLRRPCCSPRRSAPRRTLLNVSYDPTRELYGDFNTAFAQHWKAQTGEKVPSASPTAARASRRARSSTACAADVVTLALAYDIDKIAEKGKLLPADWQKRLPDNSTPYTSTIVFLVRKGNPKGIKDWGDLAKPGVSVITPNPKTSGGARWNYLAAWGWALRKPGGNEATATVPRTLFKNVPVLDTGARGSPTTFVQRGIGDVFISWENEAFLAIEGARRRQVRVVVPVHQHPCRAARGGGGQGRARRGHAERWPRPTSSTSTRRKDRRSSPSTTTVRATPRSRRSTPAASRSSS